MFAYRIALQLQPDSAARFNRIVDEEILPLLRERGGFSDALAMVTEDGVNAVTIFLWHDQAAIEAYTRYMHAVVLRYLSSVTKGPPRGRKYLVSSMTRPHTESVLQLPPVSFLAGNHDLRP